jgi:sugar (glycoside-pentoside-hexuronide) transporter
MWVMTTSTQPIQPLASGDIAQEKLKFGEKLSYLLATMAPHPLLRLTTGYLMIFYTNVIGLNPIAIGTLFLLSRIVDGISDPINGYLIDRLPRIKFGKYRSVMIGGTIVCCLNFLLLWFGPAWATSGKLTIAYISYLVLGFSFDYMDIPKNSFLPVMTANPKERSSLGMLFALGTTVSGMVVAIIAPLILSAGDLSLKAFSTLVLIVTGAVLVVGIVGALGVKERVVPVDLETKHSLKDYLNILIQRPVYVTSMYGLMFFVALYIPVAASVYFFTYVMKNLALASAVAPIQLVGLLLGIFLTAPIMRKLGKKRSCIGAALAMIIVSAIRWIDPTSLALIYISTIIGGFILGFLQPVVHVIAADNIDYVEYKMKYRSEAAVASINSLSGKVSSGIAGAIPGYVLGWAGYVAASQTQPANVITAIIWLTIGFPIFFFAASALIFGFGYNLDKNALQKVEAELSERRAANQASPK